MTLLPSFSTTTCILAYGLIFSILTATISFQRVAHAPLKASTPFLNAPTLIVGPVAIACFYTLFQVNIIYPPQMLATTSEMMIFSLIPAALLCFASGLIIRVHRNVQDQYNLWSDKPFNIVARSYGIDPKPRLRKLVVLGSLARSWHESLPWIFGEIVVIESLFNAPGLGLSLWQHAKERSYIDLTYDVTLMMGLYLLFLSMSCLVNHWIGEKLETYH